MSGIRVRGAGGAPDDEGRAREETSSSEQSSPGKALSGKVSSGKASPEGSAAPLTVVPLPPEALRGPAAHAPRWTTQAAQEWLRAGRERLGRPWWPPAAGLAGVVWAAVTAGPDGTGTCAPAPESCRPDWLAVVGVVLLCGTLVWSPWRPGLVLVALPSAAVVGAVDGTAGGVTAGPDAGFLVFLAACVWAWAQSLWRLLSRRRERRAAARVTTVTAPAPYGGGRVRRRRAALFLAPGLLLLTGAAFLGADAVAGTRATDEHLERARRTEAVVLDHAWGTRVVVLTEDARTLSLPATAPEDHPRGSAVTVLEDGDWHRLAAEPYDVQEHRAGVWLACVVGVPLVAAGVHTLRRSAALRRGPVPVLRVRVHVDRAGRTWIHPADDTTGEQAVFRVDLTPLHEPTRPPHPACAGEDAGPGGGAGRGEGAGPFGAGEGPGGGAPAGEGAGRSGEGAARRGDDGERPGEDPSGDDAPAEPPSVRFLCDGVLYGAPREGGDVVLVTTDAAGAAVAYRTLGAVRPVTRWARRRGAARPEPMPLPAAREPLPEADGTAGDGVLAVTETWSVWQAEGLPEEALLPTETPGAPRVWGPTRGVRTMGATVTVLMLAWTAWVTHTVASGGSWGPLLSLGAVAFMSLDALQMLDWRVVADRSGLWLTGAWRTRHVPWDRVERTWIASQGHVGIGVSEERGWMLVAQGRLTRRWPAPLLMIEEVTTLWTHPRLRPTVLAKRPVRRGVRPGHVVLALYAVTCGGTLLLTLT